MQITGIQDLTLVGQAASDVAHLLAELVENATSFSSPTNWWRSPAVRQATGTWSRSRTTGSG